MNGLNEDQLATLRAALEQRLDALPGLPASLAETMPSAAVEEVEASPADNASNRTLNQLLQEAAALKQAQLRVVKHALTKFADDSYGLCEHCGHEIGASRLQARPEANFCIACQTRLEQTRR